MTPFKWYAFGAASLYLVSIPAFAVFGHPWLAAFSAVIAAVCAGFGAVGNGEGV